MTLNKRQRAQQRALCDELREDDGVDPRKFFQPDRNRNREHRKSRQLCRQVQRTLELVLTGEVRDDLLNGLRVVSITPGLDSSRLVVTVSTDLPFEQFDRREIEARLASLQGKLRSEVAAAITRKQTPLLTFQVLGPDAHAPLSGEAGERP